MQCGPDPAAHKASFTWVNNTEDSNCSRKALGNSAVLTRQPALVCGTIRSQRSDEGEDEDEQDDEMSEPTQTKKTKKRKEFETDETAKELRASLPFTVPSHASSLRPSDKTQEQPERSSKQTRTAKKGVEALRDVSYLFQKRAL